MSKGEAAAEWVAVEELVPWADNPRDNDAAVAEVAESIKRFGFGAPILARRADGEVIAGHTRLKAAGRLGLAQVPVRYLDLDPADAHLLALADNKLNEKAAWSDNLAAVLRDLDVGEATSGLGFTEEELKELLGELDVPDFGPGTEDDQGTLDELDPKMVTCPHCGEEWDLRQHGQG